MMRFCLSWNDKWISLALRLLKRQQNWTSTSKGLCVKTSTLKKAKNWTYFSNGQRTHAHTTQFWVHCGSYTSEEHPQQGGCPSIVCPRWAMFSHAWWWGPLISQRRRINCLKIYSTLARRSCQAYLNIEDVTAHILVHSRIEDLSSVSDDLCRIKFEHKLTCVNTTCELFDIPQITADSNSTQHFRATYDHKISMKFLVEQFWRTLADDHGRSFGCQICGVRARWERKITDTPLLLFMSFSSPLHFDVDLHLVFGGHDYDLVVVIYFGGMHYVARMIGSDGKVLEYDGMKRYGRLAEVLSDSPFSPVIIDLSGTQRQVIGTWYKKRNGEWSRQPHQWDWNCEWHLKKGVGNLSWWLYFITIQCSKVSYRLVLIFHFHVFWRSVAAHNGNLIEVKIMHCCSPVFESVLQTCFHFSFSCSGEVSLP